MSEMSTRLEKAFQNPLPEDAADLDFDRDEMARITDACMRYAIDHIHTLRDQPIVDMDGAVELAATFDEPLPLKPQSIDELISRFGEGVEKTFNTAAPGYIAFIPGGGVYAATLADYLSMSVNRYTGMWNASPALIQIELAALNWIRELIQLPENFGGLFTSGGSISSLIAIITARRTRLPENFLDGVIYLSKESHHCIPKSILLAGFPESRIRFIQTDKRLRMDVDALRAAVEADAAAGLCPFMVVANAGSTNTGAVDPMPEISRICKDHEMWMHVDAAYGGFFRMVEGGEELLPGMELADSVVLDPHKGLFLPYGTGCLLMRDPEELRRAHQSTADYMQDLEHPTDAGVNFADISPELSRDFRGLRVWLPFKMHGVEAFRDNLREKLELTHWAYEEIKALPDFECFDEPQLSIFAFRYLPKNEDANVFNQKLVERIKQKGRVFMTSTNINGKFMIRIAILSFRTHSIDLVNAIQDIKESVLELEADSG